MSHSLNEIEALAKRAARGGGFSWGLANEAGLAARVLASFGLGGPQALAQLLAQNDGVARAQVTPISLENEWSGVTGLCPITTGASLADFAQDLRALGDVSMRNVSYPVLMVPFVLGVAAQNECVVSMEWLGVRVQTDGKSMSITGVVRDLERKLADQVRIANSDVMENPMQPKMRGRLDDVTFAQLSEFAARTYAPATEESRALGAG